MESRFRFRVLARIVALLIVGFLGLQFIRPALTNPPVTAELQVPAEVKQILKTSCYNCHSNETQLSWFDKPVPAYWLVVRDINEARKHVNFSELGQRPLAQQQATLFDAVGQIALGAMPLPAYRRLHPEAKITPEQLSVLKKYLSSAGANKVATAAEVQAADEQYERWIHGDGTPRTVAPAPNGIAFIPEYKDWKAISSTERFDNHTLRVIVGNDIAVQAIADKHNNP